MVTYAKGFVWISTDNNPANQVTSCLASPSPQYHYLTIQSFGQGQSTGGITTFVCDNANKTIASQSASGNFNLINTTTTAVSNCYFTCVQSGVGLPPTIEINFDLDPKTPDGLIPVIEKQAKIHFNTSFTMRNNF
jgi:hypothetical protein